MPGDDMQVWLRWILREHHGCGHFLDLEKGNTRVRGPSMNHITMGAAGGNRCANEAMPGPWRSFAKAGVLAKQPTDHESCVSQPNYSGPAQTRAISAHPHQTQARKNLHPRQNPPNTITVYPDQLWSMSGPTHGAWVVQRYPFSMGHGLYSTI
ncbi:hypothetical protein BJ322DRAFT_1018052 [Thelephora terrestris]|uniref:Uncharacterized protein n=1 Tax=Thelephora terrestris TaxID=56493 RepID=A0A9P6HKG2_9AGAM|nr:hypothetical protein BJ322DRAFT_1018052 [Thelephora terrestris]